MESKQDGKPDDTHCNPIVRKTALLLRAMSEIGPRITTVASEIQDGKIAPEEQVAFGKIVVRVGELIQLHALEVRELGLD